MVKLKDDTFVPQRSETRLRAEAIHRLCDSGIAALERLRRDAQQVLVRAESDGGGFPASSIATGTSGGGAADPVHAMVERKLAHGEDPAAVANLTEQLLDDLIASMRLLQAVERNRGALVASRPANVVRLDDRRLRPCKNAANGCPRRESPRKEGWCDADYEYRRTHRHPVTGEKISAPPDVVARRQAQEELRIRRKRLEVAGAAVADRLAEFEEARRRAEADVAWDPARPASVSYLADRAA